MREDINWDPIIDTARKVARDIAERWATVEAEDVQQEILTHILEQKDSLAPKLGDEEFIRKVCYKAGKQYASREQNYRDLVDDQYYYTPDEARIALKSFVYTDEEVAKMIGKKDDLTKCRISDNIITARADASVALNKLNDRYQEVLMRVLVYGHPYKNDNDRKLCNRAVDALALAMNRIIRTRSAA